MSNLFAATSRKGVQTARRCVSHLAPRQSRTDSSFDSGLGGYCSNKGLIATVFGATGFVGRYVVDKLASQGITVIVPYRGDEFETRHLNLMGDVGKVNATPFDPRVVDSVRDVVRPSQLVINLIGKDFETKHVFGSLTKNYTYDQVHAEIPRMLAQVCTEQRVDQFIHMSSLAARPDAKALLDAAKYDGELEVRTHFPDATILKPANIFGDEDRLMNTIASFGRRMPSYPLVERGDALMQPVYVNDVAEALANTIQSPAAQGATYNLAGPDVLTYRELYEFVFHVIKREPTAVDLPTPLLSLIGLFIEQFPGPWVTEDLVTRLSVDNIVEEGEENHLESLLGRQATSIEHASYRFLQQYQYGSHFQSSTGSGA